MVIEPFTKSKRPQTATDDETWVANQPNPTLNAFDQGDTRTTTVVVEDPVLMHQREGKPGGGKGPLLSNDKSLTLSGGNDQTLFQPAEEPIVFENSYRDAARIAEDGITQTLTSKMGTGGGNTPMVAQSVNYSFDTQFGSNAEVYEDKAPPLKASQQSPSIAFPIQDGRDIEKHQNGLGVADEGSPSYTIDQTGAQAVAYGLQGNMIGRQDHNGPQGAGISQPDDPMFSLTSTDRHGVVQYDGYNQRLYEDDVSVTIRIGRDSSDFIAQPAQTTMAVRRLTPLECERLMGWPDNWTATKADGTPQSDTHRYKQCGNGVASPVAQWIGEILIATDTATATDAGATD
jgi:site-specific DNA-cytosine methylase